MALTGKSLKAPFAFDLDCPHCDKEIHYPDANAELTNDSLACPHCGGALVMECDDPPYDEEGNGGLYFWLEARKD